MSRSRSKTVSRPFSPAMDSFLPDMSVFSMPTHQQTSVVASAFLPASPEICMLPLVNEDISHLRRAPLPILSADGCFEDSPWEDAQLFRSDKSAYKTMLPLARQGHKRRRSEDIHDPLHGLSLVPQCRKSSAEKREESYKPVIDTREMSEREAEMMKDLAMRRKRREEVFERPKVVMGSRQ